MTEILHRVALPSGAFANTVGPSMVIEAMYPAGLVDAAEIYIGAPKTDANGVELTAVNSVLRFIGAGEDWRAILGNTVPRGCAVAPDCGSCALAGSGLSIRDMRDKNCARANAASAFELAEQTREGRFVLLPTSKQASVVGGESFTSEYNGDELMYHRLKPASSVVFTRSWLRSRGLDQITVGMNGADGSMGVATTEIDGELLIIPFCSMRQNMGDREPEDQILRQALNAYFDSQDFDQAKRDAVLAGLQISITLAASASLENFAHQIRVPEEGSEGAARLRERYPDLVRRAGGRITSAIVLNDQYPGAMARGSIFPELEARMGIRVTPITPDNCPGDGQYCHIDYRNETEYALTVQLQDMGVPADNIHFDDQDVLDPANPGNKAASNRAEQNNGVAVANTNRTLNAMIVRW
jgi:hypothetical protein